MAVVPALRPVTTPPPFTVPVAGVLLLHVPPGGVDDNVVVEFSHTVVPPVITPGRLFTVTVSVSKQPFAVTYEMVVVPAAIPVTTPVASMVPAAVLLLVHVPPAVVFASAVVWPIQTVGVPVMIAGDAITVTTTDAEQPVPIV